MRHLLPLLILAAACGDNDLPDCAGERIRCDATSDDLICETDGSACVMPGGSPAWKCLALAERSEGVFWCESVRACLAEAIVGPECPE